MNLFRRMPRPRTLTRLAVARKRFVAFACYVPRWWNGRHAVLRGQCPFGRVSSNLTLGTIIKSSVLLTGRHGQVVRQSSAKAPPPVRIRLAPPRHSTGSQSGSPFLLFDICLVGTIMHCMISREPQRSQMLKGILDPCLLAVIAEHEAYGYEIVARLEAAGLGDVAEGTVYPALTRLERGGLLKSERRESASGPPRKYYQLTPSGRRQLDAWREEWAALAASVDSVLGGSAFQRAKESA